MIRIQHLVAILLALQINWYCGPAVAQENGQQEAQTPPRISFVQGQASFWRPGAEDWVPARLNMPLAPGDQIYTGGGANIELQTGARDFIRAAERTAFGIDNQEPDFLQVRVTAGKASLDLRTLPAGYSVELDTPNAAFTIERAGYYRVEVEGDATHFITRRGGRATVIAPGGAALSISSSEEIVVRGTTSPTLETYVAPELDDWDRWNYARTDDAIEAISSRYVSPGVYGADVLDHYGSWRVVPTYGSVWVPDGVGSGWVPYSTGSWVWDTYYGWTWVDDAPWGWAPFHYGRWVFVGGFWAWAPGPVLVRPVYAPALVSFFYIGQDVALRIGIGSPSVSWVALGWGEPVIPWWGRRGFIGTPWWGGWGGPHIVNNVVVSRTAIVNVNNITFHNTGIPSAVVAMHADRFGRGPVRAGRIEKALPLRELRATHEFAPVRGELPVKPTPRSLVADVGAAARPPQSAFSRPVVATRASREPNLPWGRNRAEERRMGGVLPATIVSLPKQPAVQARPPFGTEKGPERARPPLPPRLEEMRTPRPQPAAPQERGLPAGGIEKAPALPSASRPVGARPETVAPRPEQELRVPARRETPSAPIRPEVAAPRAIPEQGTRNVAPSVTQERRMPPATERVPSPAAVPAPVVSRPERVVPRATPGPELRGSGQREVTPAPPRREIPSVPTRPEVAVPRAIPEQGTRSVLPAVPQERRMPPAIERAPRPAALPVPVVPRPEPVVPRPTPGPESRGGGQREVAPRTEAQPKKDQRQQETPALPGQPANRLFPGQRGGDGGAAP